MIAGYVTPWPKNGYDIAALTANVTPPITTVAGPSLKNEMLEAPAATVPIPVTLSPGTEATFAAGSVTTTVDVTLTSQPLGQHEHNAMISPSG